MLTQVEKTLFCVHGYFFTRESPKFKEKLTAGLEGDVKKGTTDNDAILLTGVLPAEFEKLLWVFYNPCVFAILLLSFIFIHEKFFSATGNIHSIIHPLKTGTQFSNSLTNGSLRK